MSKFLQFHALTPYSGVLLNRDDAGFAKTLPFGNAKRTRVSSQCLKYHWRKYEGKHAIRDAGDMAIRSRNTFREEVAEELVEDGYDETLAAGMTGALSGIILSGDTSKSDIGENVQPILESDTPLDETELPQLVVFGQPEVKEILKVARESLDQLAEADYNEDSVAQTRDAIADAIAVDEVRENLSALGNAMGIDAAMHGRMVTSDVLARGNAAVHVAHAITTHAQQREDDYFTAVDDLLDADTGGEESGSAHLNTKQLTSGLFYNYVVVDVPLLVSNLESCERSEWTDADLDLTVEVLRRFLHTLATVSPGAKLSSTAPYAKAEFVMVESGDEQPRTLANSFKKAVPLTENVTEDSIERLTDYVDRMDGMYATEEDRVCATAEEAHLPADKAPLPEIADWIETKVTTYANS
jgi:CRISPR system Cascade subunit CasC